MKSEQVNEVHVQISEYMQVIEESVQVNEETWTNIVKSVLVNEETWTNIVKSVLVNEEGNRTIFATCQFSTNCVDVVLLWTWKEKI